MTETSHQSTLSNRVSYSSEPVWRDDEFALVTSNTELSVIVVLSTLNTHTRRLCNTIHGRRTWNS